MFTASAEATPPRPQGPQAVTGYTYVSKAGTYDSNRTDTAYARCPAGKVPLAGGAQIVGGQNRVLLRASHPQGSTWVAVAQELEPRGRGSGTRARWYVRSYAVCAKAPAGLSYVDSRTSYTSVTPRSRQVVCPTGKKLIGVGGRINGADHKAGINSVTVDSALLKSATVRGSRAAATSAEWSVVSFGVCTRPLGQTLREGPWTYVPGPALSKTVAVSCPRGTRSFGAGVRLHGTDATLDRLVPTKLRPTPDSVGAEATVSELVPGTPAAWYLKAQVICAR